MNEVEKYGLFAVVLVGGLITLIAVSGGDDEELATALNGPAVATAPRTPTVIPFQSSSDVPPATSRASKASPNRQVGASSNVTPSAASARRTQPNPLGRKNLTGTPASRGTQVKTIKSLMPDDEFEWGEGAMPYPGPRTSRPSSQVVQGPVQGPAQPRKSPSQYTVRSGDNLSTIAKATLGKASRWHEIVDLNPGLDPMKLQVGQLIQIRAASTSAVVAGPAASPKVETAPPPAAKQDTYTVKPGDTLSQIASATLGTTRRTDELFAANRATLKSPDALQVGQVLIIP